MRCFGGGGDVTQANSHQKAEDHRPPGHNVPAMPGVGRPHCRDRAAGIGRHEVHMPKMTMGGGAGGRGVPVVVG